MRFLITSDWHIDAVTLGVPRRPEVLRYAKHLVGAVTHERIDAVIFAGDGFDPGDMLASLYLADLLSCFRALMHASRLKRIYVIAGNHDVVEVDSALSTLKPLGMVEGIVLGEEPCVCRLEGFGERVAIMLMPYISRAWAQLRLAGVDPGPDALAGAAFGAARAAKADGFKLVTVGHQTVPGAKLGSESAEMSRGRELDIPFRELSLLEPELVINGHYHKPQTVQCGRVSVVIPGSPLSFTTDDPPTGKGYVVAEV